MSPFLVIVVGLIYTGIAIEQFYKGSLPLGIMYAGYAFSNIGLYMVAK
jgi:hypothetical protein